ncbi:MAG: biotin--[acetyl-CoA-carboxylase] ligase [Clostridia bacterium]|nr:biotin--[acetyl-CoA-carboxylase] ligase [Clostridia bacterium]
MKYKILDMLGSGSEFVSGGDLSKKLGITRSAVWKNINNLRRDGYKIESVTGRGYRLCGGPDRINPGRLEKSVPGKVYYFKSTESTNLEAKRAANVPDRSLFIADTQLGGRGRLGRKWSSPAGCGIWMSLYLKPKIAAASVSQLTLAAGLAVARAIPTSRIKWPNDVLMSNKKVCGILTEMSAEMDRVNYVVVGIGINVNNEVFGIDLIDKATSIYRETEKKTDREELLSKVLKEFFAIYDEFLKGGFASFRDEYKKLSATLSKEVIIIKNGEEQLARAVDINENGELIVEIDGKREIVNSGEVSVRGLLGYN